MSPGQGGSQDCPRPFQSKSRWKMPLWIPFSVAEAGPLGIAQTRFSPRVFLAEVSCPVAPGRGLVQVPRSRRTPPRPVDHRTILCGVQTKQAHGSGPTLSSKSHKSNIDFDCFLRKLLEDSVERVSVLLQQSDIVALKCWFSTFIML